MGHHQSTAPLDWISGMNREQIKDELDRVYAGVRSDIRTAVTRVDGFLYTVRLSARLKIRKAKKAAKQVWQELWR